MSNYCIWCLKNNTDKAEEHIIPEALGCPKGFSFSDGTVCKKCNNKLGHVDQAVIDDFDIFLFEAGVPRKKGRKPSISSRGNMVAGFKGAEKFYVFNMDKHFVEAPNGSLVAPYKGRERQIRGKLNKREGIAEVKFEVSIGKSKKFRRGIYKIALSSLAYFLGNEKALDESLNTVRNFVTNGTGDRAIIICRCSDSEFRNQVWPPYTNDHGHYSIIIRLAVFEIIADLSPNASMLPMVYKELKKHRSDDVLGMVPVNTSF